MSKPRQPVTIAPLLLPALLSFLIAAALAFLARGLAGDEEAGHFLIARYAPRHPALFLSLVGRPLVTLLLTLPAQINLQAARLVAALATAVGAAGVAWLLHRSRWLPPWAAVVLLLIQPFFLAHAATAMTEPFAAALLIWGLVAWVEEEQPLLAGLAGLAGLARFELVIFWPFVVWRLVRRRRWVWLLCLIVPLPLWNFLGGLATHDSLWLLHQTQTGTYPERDVFHYLQSLAWILGPGLVLPVLVGSAGVRFQAPAAPRPSDADKVGRQTRLAALIMTVCLLLVYTALASWQPATYGNLRYLALAGGPVALLAAAGLHDLARLRSSRTIAITCAVALGLALLAWNHPLHHDFVFLKRWDFLTAGAVLLVAIVAWLTKGRPLPLVALVGLLGLAGLAIRHQSTLHLAPSEEQAAATAAAREVQRRGLSTRLVYSGHLHFALALGVDPYDPAQCPPLTDRVPATASPGALLLWDTHYTAPHGARVGPDAFLKDPRWEFLFDSTARDSTWGGALFRRSATPVTATPETRRAARAWSAGTRMIMSGIPQTREILLADPGDPERWLSLAIQYLANDRMADAQAAFAEANRLAPGAPGNEAFTAALAIQQGRPEDALAAMKRALILKPDDVNYHFQAGRLLTVLHRDEEARPHLVLAAERLPKRWDVQYVLGALQYDHKEWAATEQHLDAAARMNPLQVDATMMAAEAAFQQGRFEIGEARLTDLIRRKPELARPYLMLSNYLAQRGRTDEARRVLQTGADRTGDAELRRRLAGGN